MSQVGVSSVGRSGGTECGTWRSDDGCPRENIIDTNLVKRVCLPSHLRKIEVDCILTHIEAGKI
jgi:hypothetical protein